MLALRLGILWPETIKISRDAKSILKSRIMREWFQSIAHLHHSGLFLPFFFLLNSDVFLASNHQYLAWREIFSFIFRVKRDWFSSIAHLRHSELFLPFFLWLYSDVLLASNHQNLAWREINSDFSRDARLILVYYASSSYRTFPSLFVVVFWCIFGQKTRTAVMLTPSQR